MARERILIVEDERDIAELISYNLTRQGYATEVTPDAESALEALARRTPAAVILDLLLPGLSGLELCRRLKLSPESRDLPVIMLTARSQDSDIVAGLEAGADDYVTKPFSPRVLAARLRAVLRRARPDSREADEVRVDDLSMDPLRRSATLGGASLELSATEFDLLYLLARHPGRVFTRSQIISNLKGDDYPVTERSVDVQVVGLRRKLGERAELLQTVRGVGYRLREPPPGKAE